MNETINAIKNRRSYRSFQETQILEEHLESILEAAIYAPSAMNQQKWHFTVVQDKKMIDVMVNGIKENMSLSDNEYIRNMSINDKFHPFYHAPTIIIISGEEQALSIALDCGLATQNIVLSAESINIGSCIIGMSDFFFSSDESKPFKIELGIPEGYKVFCSIVLGYKPENTPDTPTRNKSVINYIR